ncbi:MAG: hypothetical protein RIQ56_17, partial [Candidatus Parcubacteria bacterium]
MIPLELDEIQFITSLTSLVASRKSEVMPLLQLSIEELKRNKLPRRELREIERAVAAFTAATPGRDPKLQVLRKLASISEQRPLSKEEEDYIRSIEDLSVYNPILAGIASIAPRQTEEFLRAHYESLTERTWNSIGTDQFFEGVMVGAGPHGTLAMSERARVNPAYAGETLVIDSFVQPGGVFALPGGPALIANSANLKRTGRFTIGDMPEPVPPEWLAEGETDIERVGQYGARVGSVFPGERPGGSPTRAATINPLSPYLLNPDDVSSGRYPSN